MQSLKRSLVFYFKAALWMAAISLLHPVIGLIYTT